MAVTLVNKGAFASGTGAITIAVPASIVAGDLLILMAESANEAFVFTSSAEGATWTQLTGSPLSRGTAAAIGGVRLGVWWKVYTGTQASVGINDTGNHTVGQMIAFRGIKQSSPIEAVADQTDATAIANFSCPSITSLSPNAMILNIIGLDRDAASTTLISNVANTDLASITVGHQQTISSGVGGGLAWFYGIDTAAGMVKATTGTESATAGFKVYFTLSIQSDNELNSEAVIKATTKINGPGTAINYAAPSITPIGLTHTNPANAASETVDAVKVTDTIFAYVRADNNNYQGIIGLGELIDGTLIMDDSAGTFTDNAVSPTTLKIAAMDATHFLIIWRDDDGTFDGKAVVATYNPTYRSFSFGTILSFTGTLATISNYSYSAAIAVLSSTSAVIVFGDNSDSQKGKSVGITRSDTTLSIAATAVNFNNYQTDYVSVSPLDSTRFIVFYQYYQSLTVRPGYCKIGTFTGSSITYGLTYLASTDATVCIGPKVKAIDSTHAILTGDWGNKYQAVYATITGNAIAFGAALDLETSLNVSGLTRGLEVLDSSRFFIAAQHNATLDLNFFTITLSGTTLSIDANTVFASGLTIIGDGASVLLPAGVVLVANYLASTVDYVGAVGIAYLAPVEEIEAGPTGTLYYKTVNGLVELLGSFTFKQLLIKAVLVDIHSTSLTPPRAIKEKKTGLSRITGPTKRFIKVAKSGHAIITGPTKRLIKAIKSGRIITTGLVGRLLVLYKIVSGALRITVSQPTRLIKAVKRGTTLLTGNKATKTYHKVVGAVDLIGAKATKIYRKITGLVDLIGSFIGSFISGVQVLYKTVSALVLLTSSNARKTFMIRAGQIRITANAKSFIKVVKTALERTTGIAKRLIKETKTGTTDGTGTVTRKSFFKKVVTALHKNVGTIARAIKETKTSAVDAIGTRTSKTFRAIRANVSILSNMLHVLTDNVFTLYKTVTANIVSSGIVSRLIKRIVLGRNTVTANAKRAMKRAITALHKNVGTIARAIKETKNSAVDAIGTRTSKTFRAIRANISILSNMLHVLTDNVFTLYKTVTANIASSGSMIRDLVDNIFTFYKTVSANIATLGNRKTLSRKILSARTTMIAVANRFTKRVLSGTIRMVANTRRNTKRSILAAAKLTSSIGRKIASSLLSTITLIAQRSSKVTKAITAAIKVVSALSTYLIDNVFTLYKTVTTSIAASILIKRGTTKAVRGAGAAQANLKRTIGRIVSATSKISITASRAMKSTFTAVTQIASTISRSTTKLVIAQARSFASSIQQLVENFITIYKTIVSNVAIQAVPIKRNITRTTRAAVVIRDSVTRQISRFLKVTTARVAAMGTKLVRITHSINVIANVFYELSKQARLVVRATVGVTTTKTNRIIKRINAVTKATVRRTSDITRLVAGSLNATGAKAMSTTKRIATQVVGRAFISAQNLFNYFKEVIANSSAAAAKQIKTLKVVKTVSKILAYISSRARRDITTLQIVWQRLIYTVGQKGDTVSLYTILKDPMKVRCTMGYTKGATVEAVEGSTKYFELEVRDLLGADAVLTGMEIKFGLDTNPATLLDCTVTDGNIVNVVIPASLYLEAGLYTYEFKVKLSDTEYDSLVGFV